MRRLLAISALFLLLAGGAGAQSTPNLRGSQGSAPTIDRGVAVARASSAAAKADAQPAPPLTVIAPPAPPGPPMSPVPTYGLADQAPQCRASCSRGYYFCLSGGEASDDCGGSWAQCVSRCNRPAA